MERIYGVHAARAVLANGERRILAVYATRNGLARLADNFAPLPNPPVEVSPDQLTRKLGREAVHQGILVEAAPLAPVGLDETLAGVSATNPLVVLDQVTDPHNVGAVMRSAAVFGARAVIMTRRNSPPLDGVVAKAASGAVEHVPIVLVANLARALDDIGKAGIQRVGLESDTDVMLESADLLFPCALVLGAEHKGLRRLTRENCDQLCRLMTRGAISSLNVSNAAAVALHVLMQRSQT